MKKIYKEASESHLGRRRSSASFIVAMLAAIAVLESDSGAVVFQ
jgi:hypothetical protein